MLSFLPTTSIVLFFSLAAFAISFTLSVGVLHVLLFSLHCTICFSFSLLLFLPGCLNKTPPKSHLVQFCVSIACRNAFSDQCSSFFSTGHCKTFPSISVTAPSAIAAITDASSNKGSISSRKPSEIHCNASVSSLPFRLSA